MPLDLAPPPKLWTPSRPAIIRASDLPRSYAEAKKIAHKPDIASFPMPTFVPAANTPATIAYTDKKISGSDASYYNHGSASIGTAASGRRVGAAVATVYTVDGRTSALAINGNSATQIETQQGPFGCGGYVRISLFILQVDSGTTATFEVTTSGGVLACGLIVWEIHGLGSSTPNDTAKAGGSSPYTDTLNILKGGVSFGATCTYAPTTTTWTGLANEAVDETVETSFLSHSGAHEAFADAQTGRTITATPSTGPSSGAMAAVALR